MPLLDGVRRTRQVAAAFIRMGYLLEFSYPLAFVMTQAQALLPVFIYFFVARLVPHHGPSVGGDYFTFVVIGALSVRILGAGLNDLGTQVNDAIQQGQFEMLLVEPVRWRALPLGMAQWPLVVRAVTSVITLAITVFMGAHYRATGVPLALVITLLGAFASLAIGSLALSVKVLAKRSDPVLAVYGVIVQVLAGAYFPVKFLPLPLRVISYALPHTYVIAANRAVLMPHGSSLPGPSPATAVIGLVCFSVVGYAFALWLLGRTFDYARRIGVLGGY